MTTQKQVALELIGKHIAAYRELDVHNVYSERLTKAEALLKDAQVHRQADGSYLVQGSRPEPYVVNGTCQCEDYVRLHAPSGWCKHRLAAKTYQVVLDDMIALQRSGVPHLHFVCEHASRMELCWTRSCDEPMDQLCASCCVNLDDVEQSGMSPAELADLANGWEAVPELVVPTTTPEEELKALAAPVYEENPSAQYVCAAPGKGKKAPVKSVVMPEAPASQPEH